MQKVFVRVLQGWPERVIGEDMKAYPLIAGSKIALPPKMARILIDAKLCEPVMVADAPQPLPILMFSENHYANMLFSWVIQNGRN